MNNTKKVLITLEPLGRLFFGGEKSFKRENEDFDSEHSSYIIHSEQFPQQTSLLGMLRFVVLSADQNVFERGSIPEGKRMDAARLIGYTGFSVGEKMTLVRSGLYLFVFCNEKRRIATGRICYMHLMIIICLFPVLS
ncbi:MAG: hypothetical protein LIP04_08525 [Tannerellaceae bacterium]|nr:hypothetical protein [Tannerellaceae bacterium]